MTIYKSSWLCPSNIALVKYWGKKPEQLPMNPSLSFSLKQARTRTSVAIVPKSAERLLFLFEGKESSFDTRIRKYLDKLAIDLPWINDYSFEMESSNTFPHSTGIASSASAFGALALCLADLNSQLTGTSSEDDQFFQTASRLARLGSGSASRSVYGGFAWWGKSAAMKGSTDCYAVPVSNQIHESYFSLCDAVLLVDSQKKKVSSSAGHDLMNNHPYQAARLAQANQTIEQLIGLMKTDGNRMAFIDLVEQEALSLHALMMSSTPSFLLLKPGSLEIIEKIREFRQQTGLPVGFTIDAGPNIHLLYWKEDQEAVHAFIRTELLYHTENGEWLDDRVGEGPVKA
ncbi:diphosphomevalonate decarboxylase [Mangrovibacterium diazotrophicum]|uniref:diphosphomevalonate decarboxylase n=1 Tax=Mangrovibacterium diazotrophicum TaxID=1261403 RepID=A0A419W830_9BACT|nr:diphosphomevalonate decarboxylase [Mangrovibacterium diazotrophicum]RKD91619.1 diphosphomevalonate decarboxylase [Mangrovibacterium diazotrophicum]